MESIIDKLRQEVKAFERADSERRIATLFHEVIEHAMVCARMGLHVDRFDAYWPNNNETREVCRMIANEGILDAVTDLDDNNITESILSNEPSQRHRLDPNIEIQSLFLKWY